MAAGADQIRAHDHELGDLKNRSEAPDPLARSPSMHGRAAARSLSYKSGPLFAPGPLISGAMILWHSYRPQLWQQ